MSETDDEAEADPRAPATREALRLARKSRRQQGRREGVLEAARDVVVSDGLAFTMDRVAAAADVSKPALYYYFKSKEALVTALAIEILRVEVDAVARAIVDAGGGLEAIAALIRARVDHYRDDPDGFRILYLWAPVLGVEEGARLTELVPLTEVVTHALEQRLDRDRRRGLIAASVHPHRLAMITWTSAQGVLSLTLGMGVGVSPYSIDELADEAIRTLQRAARAPKRAG